MKGVEGVRKDIARVRSFRRVVLVERRVEGVGERMRGVAVSERDGP